MLPRTSRPDKSTCNIQRAPHDPSCDNQRIIDSSCDNHFRYELSVGIDFGTSHCAVAYSYQGKENDIHVFTNWPDGTPTLGKIPTAILFDSEERCLNFGYGALKQYKELVDLDEHEDTFLFRNFKMQLYQEKKVNEEMIIEDISGKKMKAIDVFSASIRYMKETLLSDIKHRRADLNITDRLVRWVITVPAIWCDAARQFMRKAAEKAGCNDRSIAIALEPETASIYCRNTKSSAGENNSINARNSKYLVIDNGGGTLDVTAHEVIEENNLKELFRASGGDLGGNKVNEHFQILLEGLFSKENIQTIRKEFPEEWIRVLQEFDTKKKELNSLDNNKEVSISLSGDCPWKKDHFHSLPDAVKKGIKLTKKGRLFFQSNLIVSLVESVSKEIRKHVSSLLQNNDLENIDHIIMVGGFSNSRIVVDDIKELVKHMNIKVVVPEQTELCVVMGAVMFGWKQDIIRSRKARKTYGFRVNRKFVEGVHDPKRAYEDLNGEKRCDDLMSILVRINDDIPLDHKIKHVTSHSQRVGTGTGIKLYSTEKPDPVYSDEEGVTLIGKFTVPRSAQARGKKIYKEVYFGGTEIKVVITDETTGRKLEGNFDFLSQNCVKLLD